ncbi:pyrroloquinoline-quinone synthase PqqC [Rhodomicrobium sp. Az07]|uniref:pyrroloquinoline-quinone synthase PqqC n=1 Tax=Rhodomicrobium sp. Az07 TaxID=2839034 RepID=UPI001BE9E023|nr:pyrroloquinoline-quinone synthase PqqC [Rhodomicrobium sp. Az07]MBT3069901.1 pyrroloquinoline-quinone synthase PqqC [Rhodomicrobium sp. Az07]
MSAADIIAESATAPDLDTTVPADGLSPEGLEALLREIGARRYHNLHPFHKLLHGGELSKQQVRAWALNRYYYQATIPRKDTALMSKMPDRAMRLEWRQRYFDHDGIGDDEGGIARWLRLTDALGLPRAYVESARGILPGTRFACDAYLNFVREKTLIEGIASSLTELFAPGIHSERISGMLAHYDFIDDAMMGYFTRRLAQAPRDVEFALTYVKEHARTPEAQQAVVDALLFKTQVLWAQLDALHFAYVEPGLIAPGAFRP